MTKAASPLQTPSSSPAAAAGDALAGGPGSTSANGSIDPKDGQAQPASPVLTISSQLGSAAPGRRVQRPVGRSVVTTKISARIPEDLVDAAKKAAGDAGLSNLIEDALRDRLAAGQTPTATATAGKAGAAIDPDLIKRLVALTDQVDQLKSKVESFGDLKQEIETIKKQSSASVLHTRQLVDSTREQLQQMRLMLAVFSKPLALDHLDVFRGAYESAANSKKAKQ